MKYCIKKFIDFIRIYFIKKINKDEKTTNYIKLTDINFQFDDRSLDFMLGNAYLFRETIIVPSLQKYDKVTIDLDYLPIDYNIINELFSGLLRYFTKEELYKKLIIKSHSDIQVSKIWSFIDECCMDKKVDLKSDNQLLNSIRSSSSVDLIKNSSINLHSNKWISLLCMRNPSKHIYEYIYSTETRCKGIVAFIPFRLNGDIIEVLIRYEATPCWDGDRQVGSSFTGGIDHNSTPVETAIKEIKEETGYSVDKTELISLGQTFGIKSSDTIYHLYAVDLSHKDSPTELTVETELEQFSFNKWSQLSQTVNCIPDAIYGMLAFRLIHFLMTTLKKI